ncbi:MAG TPA: VOC family protein [Terriglobales bacterium]|nr:VOC family protein [Terriglobales bacterium]
MANVSPIPAGYHSVTPYIIVTDSNEAIEFYKRAFGAEEIMRMPGPGGRIIHAEIRIGDSVVMLSDEYPDMGNKAPINAGCTTAALMVYVPDVDASYAKAVAAGAKSAMPVENMFWGDRYGQVIDPYGHRWSLATHVEDLSPAEMEQRQQEFFAKMKAAS